MTDTLSFFFFSSRRRHTRSLCDWSSDVCSSDLDGRILGKVTSRAPAAAAALAALAALAEDPERHVEPPEGSRQVVDPRYTVVVTPDGRWAGVCALRLPADEAALAAAVADVRALTAGSELVLWNAGSSATPSDLPQRLRTYGLQDP